MNKLINSFLSLSAFLFTMSVSALNIDGVLSEQEWENADYLENFLTVFPNDKSIPKYKTKVKYFTNEEGIFFGIINEQPLETQISQKHPRDTWDVNADRIFLIIDFDANANAGYEFAVTLGDSLRDAIWVNENDVSDNWDAIWQAKTSQSDNFWIAEYFLPWGVVPMANVDDELRKIKFSVGRKVQHLSRFFNMPGLWGQQSPFLSRMQETYIKNYKNESQSERNIDFFPYISATNNFIENNRNINFGGEIFWDIDSEAKLDISLNPDFGQVESDDVIVNFSANETFYPDKRPFFTENQTLFEITGWDLRFINTRRIGGIPDKCSSTNESHKGQCDDYIYDSTDINFALRYSKKGKINKYGIFTASEDDTIFSEGRDFLAFRYKTNLSKNEGKIGYLMTSADRPSIDRKAIANVLDFDFKPSPNNRIYGWAGEIDIDEKGTNTKGYGFKFNYTSRINQDLFAVFYSNYHDENFDINDMGYIKQYDNFSLGAYLQYFKPNTNPESNILQTEMNIRLGHQRSVEGEYGNGIGTYFEYKLQYKDSSSLKLECYCNFIRGKDYEETRKFINAPFIEELSGIRINFEYESSSQKEIQSVYKASYGTFGYQTQIENLDLRNESTSFGYTNIFKPSELIQLNMGWFEYRKQSNWSIWSKENLFGYYDKEQLSSSLSLDYFIGSNQEFRIKGKIYGIKAQNPRSYRVSPSGYMNDASDNMNAFQLSETAFQIRYKYEFSPLSNLYVVYTKGGKSTKRFDQSDNFQDIYSDAWTNESLDKFIIKLRLKF